MNTFHPFKIKEIIRETSKAVSLSFEIPENLQNEFQFYAGQYVTIKTIINGAEIRRAYSLCSAPNSGEFKVTVKEVEAGSFSVIANNRLVTGDTLEVHPPQGRFILKPNEQSKNYVAFVAGSGITPVLSIIKTMLRDEPKSKFVLIYGNKSSDDTIFFKELLELQFKHPNRLFIEFIYSRIREKNAHFGRIESSTVEYIIKNKFKDHPFDEFYLCGPENMINDVTKVLKKNGVQERQIHFELFMTTTKEKEIKSELDGKTRVSIRLNKEDFEFNMDMKEMVLDMALEEDIDVPYSCQGGNCSSCMARITEGRAIMRKNQILTDEEIEEGFILTCQAYPTSHTLKLDFDDL
ncbi:ferredoxin--NADP reductase [Gelidibacter salicanalis]|uniref:Ferredoxin--NADP reductase n=1 Tax=Gelidibacter salicanalis TaxID=291193 RepID=A0A934KU14_9FLAO|nr:ferredoxin--NADP reductase [Gelidibacter salicanalis]MBJ7880743.1 ferredoxin--NADP reductase [Gelidibacter salicanalis]